MVNVYGSGARTLVPLSLSSGLLQESAMDETIVTAYLGIPMPSIELFEKPNKREKARTVLYDALGDLTECSNTIDFRMRRKFVHPEIQLLDKT